MMFDDHEFLLQGVAYILELKQILLSIRKFDKLDYDKCDF